MKGYLFGTGSQRQFHKRGVGGRGGMVVYVVRYVVHHPIILSPPSSSTTMLLWMSHCSIVKFLGEARVWKKKISEKLAKRL